MAVSKFSLKQLPEWFWYEKSSTTHNWTSTPVGHPYVSRLIGGHSNCYLDVVSGTIKEKCKLVLSDWTAEQWDVDKLAEVKEHFLYLMQEGFEIFVWQNDQEEPLVKLTPEKLEEGVLDSDNFRENISPILEKDLIRVAAELKGIAVDELCVLNVVRLKALLGHDGFFEGQHYYVSENEVRKSRFQVSKLKECIKGDHDGKILSDIISRPNIKFSLDILSILLQEPYALQCVRRPEALLFRSESEYVSLTIHGDFFFENGRVLNIGFIETWSESAKKAFQESVMKITDLRSLSCDSVLTFIPKFDLKSLRNLKFLDCSISWKTTPDQIPLDLFRNIKSLKLRGKVELSLLKYILEHAGFLENLEVGHLFDTQNIEMAPGLFKKLKTLKIHICKCAVSSGSEHLKELRVENWSTNSDDFQETLSKFPNLEILSLTNVEITSGNNISFPEGALNSLKELNLVDFSMNSNLLKSILHRNHGLKILSILPKGECANVFDDRLVLVDLQSLTVSLDIYCGSEEYLKTIEVRKFMVMEAAGPIYKIETSKKLEVEKLFFRAGGLKFLEGLKSFRMHVDENQRQEILLHARNLDRESVDFLKNILRPHHVSDVSSASPFSSVGKNKPKPKSVVNMNTKQDANTKFNLTKVFWGINTADPFPGHYRISAYDTLETEGNITLTNQHPEKNETNLELRLPEHTPYFCEQDTFSLALQVPLAKGEESFYGKTSLILSSEWQSLPSLSAQETITHLHVPFVHKEDIELQYSVRDRLYYIRMKPHLVDVSPKEISVDFLLKTRWPINRNAEECSEPLLRKLSEKYKKNLGDEGLPQDATDDASDYKTEAEILEALQAQTLVGACRHRAIAFKAEADRLITEGKLSAKTRVRVIENDCHTYVEVEEGTEEEVKGLKESICIDLGGHPANINVVNDNAPPGIATTPETVPLPANTSSVEFLPETKEQKELKDISHSRFNTWTPKISQAVNLKMYAQHVLTGFSEYNPAKTVKNYLVNLDSKESIEDFRLYLQAECLGHKDKEVFYIDSPEDLVCSSNWIERVGDKGIPRKGPGGPLHAFLSRDAFKGEHKKTPILVVNWNNFKPSDVIKLNALYDIKERRADGTVLPEHTRVVGLFNTNNPKSYKGDDFFRRWDVSILSPSLLKALPHTEEVHTFKQFWEEKSPESAVQETEVIDLYESSDWKEILLGRWVLHGKELVFEEGKLKAALARACAEHKPLEIKNGLWNNDSFRTFWQQEKLAGRLAGIDHFFHSKGYDWTSLCQPKDTVTNITLKHVARAPEGEEVYVLNPTVFSKCMYDYTFKPSKSGLKEREGVKGDLFKVPGHLQTHAMDSHKKAKPLSLYITRDLSTHQWAELLETAKGYGISLDVSLAPNVSLPSDLKIIFKQETKEETEDLRIHMPKVLETMQSSIYITSDINYTVSKLQNQKENVGCKIINVSELEAQDLLERLTTKMAGLEYSFFNTKNVLLSLNAGETVILKGRFKPELVDALASLCISDRHVWVNGQKIVLPGKLLLVSEDEKTFSFAPVIKENELEILEFKAKLIKDIQSEQKGLSENEWLATRSVIQLKSILRYVQTTGNDPKTNWDGLLHISENRTKAFKDETGILDIDISLEASEAFKKARYKQIDDVLRGNRVNPFVFIAGSTGVGKSSFIQKELENIAGSPYQVYVGLKNIQEWVGNSKHAEYPVLFIDEANIEAGDFSNYEGLFDNPPHMLIDGKYVFLTDKHKVIFAGNPLSYGSRKMPALFNDYGGSVVFPPMSPAYLHHQVLKPILSANIGVKNKGKKISEEEYQKISLKILLVYQQVVNMSEDSVLMTPRELQMMALLIMAKYKNIGEISEQNIAKIIKTIAEPLIPKKYKNKFETFFTKNFGVLGVVEHKDRIIPATPSTDAFLVTASRREIDDEISEFLSVRQLKRESQEDALKYAAGLGGIVLEGEPGVGKSEFVINLLVEKGFKEKHFKGEFETIVQDASKNYFYRMPVSMQESDKEKLLLQAFHEGSIVVIDEINSSPMMERLLNALLMGYDLEGNRPINPGFMIIGTQNPVSMAGREAQSSAVEHRFFKRVFAPYVVPEMKSIVQQRGLSVQDAEELLEDYDQARRYAKEHRKEPAPTFGHVMGAVKVKLEAQKRTRRGLVFKEAAETAVRLAVARHAGGQQSKQREMEAIFGYKKIKPISGKKPSSPRLKR